MNDKKLDKLYSLRQTAERSMDDPEKEAHWESLTESFNALTWAISRLDPQLRFHGRAPANEKHNRNTKTYSITMAPEDHDRLVALGKELHIEGGFSGVLTYIAQSCTLIHENDNEKH